MPISTILSSVTAEELDLVLSRNNAFLGTLTGYLAEAKLQTILEQTSNVGSISKIDDNATERGDLLISYNGVNLTIEVKSISLHDLRTNLSGPVSWYGSCKNVSRLNGSASPYSVGDYDLLAVSLFSATQTWEFAYLTKSELQTLSRVEGKYPQRIRLNSNHFSINRTLDEALCLATH